MNEWYKIDLEALPPNWPTHKISREFWEELGRTIACYGFLEDTIGRAIYAITATQQYENISEEQLQKWFNVTLKGALTDPLGPLIAKYEAAYSDNPHEFENFDKLIKDLYKAKIYRNVLSHASWQSGGNENEGKPRFFNRKEEAFDGKFTAASLKQIREFVIELCVAIIHSVTSRGFTFPGSGGPGKPIG